MPYLTSESFNRNYVGALGSKAFIVCVVVYAIAILIPLLFTFAGQSKYSILNES